jgi:hypothetical protein
MFTTDELQKMIREAVRKFGGGAACYSADNPALLFKLHGGTPGGPAHNAEPLRKRTLREQVREQVRKAVVAALSKADFDRDQSRSQLEAPASEWAKPREGRTPEPSNATPDPREFMPATVEPVSSLHDLVMAQIRGQVPTPRGRGWDGPQSGFLNRDDLRTSASANDLQKRFSATHARFEEDFALPHGFKKCYWCGRGVHDSRQSVHVAECEMLKVYGQIERGEGLAKSCHPGRF